MRWPLSLILISLGGLAAASHIAYDEFDGRRAGWAAEGLGEWAGPGASEQGGKFLTVPGNSWRKLASPVERTTVWYAITMRMQSPIKGYASIVPAASLGSQMSELGFNTAYGNDQGLWGANGKVSGISCLKVQTFLQRYDLAEKTWSAWALPGDGLSFLNEKPEPIIKDAPMGADQIVALYLTKGSEQVLEVERLALATTAEEALTPVAGGTQVVVPPPAPVRPPSPGIQALLSSSLRSGDRISFFGDSITWQNGYIELLQKALKERHVALINRGINGGKSTDLRDGVKDLYGQNQAPFKAILAKDKPDAVVISIGINDVWHGEKGNSAEVYEKALRTLVADAKAIGARVVLAAPSVIGEKSLGANPLDTKLDAYAAVMAKVARETGSSFVNLRAIFGKAIGAGKVEEEGTYTYDGVHMLPKGNELLADSMAAGLASAFVFDVTPQLDLVPMPKSVIRIPDLFHLKPNEVYTLLAKGPVPQVAMLPDGLRRIARTKLTPGANGRFQVRLGTLGTESYRLVVTPFKVSISAESPRAVAYAISTLLQLVRPDGKIPCVVIDDKPDHAFRALLVDVARQWHSVATLKNLVDLCFMSKVNFIQLHLTDDQSFTFPTKAFPLLPTPGRSYSREDLKDLQAYAETRGVTIIPELEMPGHGGQMVSKMGDLFRAHARHHATINFAKPEVLTALDTLLAEVAEVFPKSPYIHIGGDEADLEFVQENPDFQAAMAREGMADKHELFRWFITRMNKTVKKLGKQMIVWEGFAPLGKPEIPKDILVMAFESSYYAPDALVRDGFTVINTSWRPLYVVNQRNWSPEEIYAWNPKFWSHFVEGMPSYPGIQLGPEAVIPGAMMCAWEQPEKMELPSLRLRLPAMAERLWNTSLRARASSFARRSLAVDARLNTFVGFPATPILLPVPKPGGGR